LVGIIMNFSKIYYIFLLAPLSHLFLYQVYNLDKNNNHSCLKIFKSNNLLGLLIFICLLTEKII